MAYVKKGLAVYIKGDGGCCASLCGCASVRCVLAITALGKYRAGERERKRGRALF